MVKKRIFNNNIPCQNHQEEKEWFLSIKSNERDQWFRVILETGMWFPFQRMGKNYEEIVSYIEPLKDEFKLAFLETISNLILNLTEEDLKNYYLIYQLSWLSYELELNTTYDTLLKLAESEQYIDKFEEESGHVIEIQQVLLQIVFCVIDNKKLLFLCNRMKELKKYPLLIERKIREISARQ